MGATQPHYSISQIVIPAPNMPQPLLPKLLPALPFSLQKTFWRHLPTSSRNNHLIHTAATHSFEDIHTWGEPNVPPPQPFGIIHDGISIRISAMSEGGRGNEWYNMNWETNKYSSMALSDVQPYREWETEILECFQVNHKIKWSTTSSFNVSMYIRAHTY